MGTQAQRANPTLSGDLLRSRHDTAGRTPRACGRGARRGPAAAALCGGEPADRQRRLHEERLKAAEQESKRQGVLEGKRQGELEGERRGERRGKRRGKLLGALDTARLMLARDMSPDDLEQTMSRLSQMTTVEEIHRALSELSGERS
jgi:hypothetical protein